MGKKTPYFYRDKPLFAIDIGNNNLRIMQVMPTAKLPKVVAYGKSPFPPETIKDGVIVDPVKLATVAKELIQKNLKGKLSTNRVALAVPSARTFSRAIELPHLDEKDIDDAVRLEAEQYIPENLDKLYLDYTMISKTDKETELFAVAAPKTIIDSYVAFAQELEMDPVIIETSIHAASRLFLHTDTTKVPSVLIDLGSVSADITIVDNAILATGTVTGGGAGFMQGLIKTLGVTPEEARIIMTQDGLTRAEKTHEVAAAIQPELDELYTEIRRMIRYYEERYTDARKINQIVLMGAANIPGLSDKMTDELRIPVRNTDPWDSFTFDDVPALDVHEHATYITAAGLAIINPTDVFA